MKAITVSSDSFVGGRIEQKINREAAGEENKEPYEETRPERRRWWRK